MSQYGAYGAARKGLTWKQILAFYYPGTRLSTMSAGIKIRVRISADNDSSLRVLPATGLTVRDTAGHRYTVPTGAKYTSWRISRSGHRLPAQLPDEQRNLCHEVDRADHGHLVILHWYQDRQGGASEWFSASVPRDCGADQERTGGRTVNDVLLEDYVKAVVPAEMPTSWAANAVRAQAVAARSYAVRLRKFSGSSGYHICDTTACQLYGGMSRETTGGNAAVNAGVIVTYQGVVALTQYPSSNGGHAARGDYPPCARRSL
jgi:stage II sporulation protein D